MRALSLCKQLELRVKNSRRSDRGGFKLSMPGICRQFFSFWRALAQVQDPRFRSFAPTDFIHHMEEHRKALAASHAFSVTPTWQAWVQDVAVILERHWRDYIVSEAA